MTAPRNQPRPHIGLAPESLARPRMDNGEGKWDDIEQGLRVSSPDYGPGRVVAITASGVQIYWDRPLDSLPGVVEVHMLVHDWSYVARLERL